jgi:hypothetical protein
MVGAFFMVLSFFVRDYDPEMNERKRFSKMLDHKEAIIHLSWFHYS